MASPGAPTSCSYSATSDTYRDNSTPRSLASALNSLGSALSGLSSGLNDLESDLNSACPTPDSPRSSDMDFYGEEQTTKDPEYYRPTGDCIVLAEGVLFKVCYYFCLSRNPLKTGQVHKLLLTKHSTEFDMMLIEAEYPTNYKADESLPVLRVDDSAEAFRRLCWTLYAR